MKFTFPKVIALALAAALFGAIAFEVADAQVIYQGSNGSVTSGVSIVGTGGTTETLPTTTDTLPGLAQNNTYTGQTFLSASSTFAQGTTFSTNPLANPLLQATTQTIPVASINAAGGFAFLTSAVGRTITPYGLTVMASGGNSTSNTAIDILCSSSGKVLASIPISGLINNIPFSPFASAGTGIATTNPVYASQGLIGCLASDALIISNVGSSITGASSIIVNMPFTVNTAR